MSQLMILDGYDNPLGDAPRAKRKRSTMAGKKHKKGNTKNNPMIKCGKGKFKKLGYAKFQSCVRGGGKKKK